MKFKLSRIFINDHDLFSLDFDNDQNILSFDDQKVDSDKIYKYLRMLYENNIYINITGDDLVDYRLAPVGYKYEPKTKYGEIMTVCIAANRKRIPVGKKFVLPVFRSKEIKKDILYVDAAVSMTSHGAISYINFEAMQDNIPKCFDLCKDPYCTMKLVHCGIKEWPPMHRCVECKYWFTNREKEEDAIDKANKENKI